MRVLAFDYGQRRIGVAKSDELGLTAQPLEVYTRRSRRKDLHYLAGLVQAVKAELIVVGLPLNMNGTTGPAAREAEVFGRDLAGMAGVPVVYVDERLSTVAAERDLRDMSLSHQRRRQEVDRTAAALILQIYLERTGRKTASEDKGWEE